MMCKVRLSDTELANKAVRDNTLTKTMQEAASTMKPESVYFTIDNGCRCAYYVFDMRDSSQMPEVAERFFFLNAEVNFCPVMTPDDLAKGLRAVGEKR
jgi:hypothetical protein